MFLEILLFPRSLLKVLMNQLSAFTIFPLSITNVAIIVVVD